MGAKRLGGNDKEGNVLGAKRLGEEMVWGRNDPDSSKVQLPKYFFNNLPELSIHNYSDSHRVGRRGTLLCKEINIGYL